MIDRIPESIRHMIAIGVMALAIFAIFGGLTKSVSLNLVSLSPRTAEPNARPQQVPAPEEKTLSPLAGITESVKSIGAVFDRGSYPFPSFSFGTSIAHGAARARHAFGNIFSSLRNLIEGGLSRDAGEHSSSSSAPR